MHITSCSCIHKEKSTYLSLSGCGGGELSFFTGISASSILGQHSEAKEFGNVFCEPEFW